MVDIGCGAGSLRKVLPPEVEYQGVDIVARDEQTIVVDLNSQKLPPIAGDAVALLGVLEYINSPGDVIQQLTSFPKVIVSYNHRSIHDILWALGIRECKVSWRHRFSRREFGRLLTANGLEVIKTRRIRMGETMFICRPSKRLSETLETVSVRTAVQN